MENVLTEQPFLGKIQVVISKFSSKVKSASYSLAFNGNSAFLRRLIVAVREAMPSARSRFLDYSGTHSPCIFAFNFRYTLFTLLPLTKQLLIVLLGRVENPRLGLLLHTTLTFFSFCCRKTVIHSLRAISGWVRSRSHGALRKIHFLLARV